MVYSYNTDIYLTILDDEGNVENTNDILVSGSNAEYLNPSIALMTSG